MAADSRILQTQHRKFPSPYSVNRQARVQMSCQGTYYCQKMQEFQSIISLTFQKSSSVVVLPRTVSSTIPTEKLIEAKSL